MKPVLKILVVEDSEDDALLILHEIKKGGYDIEFERVETAEDMKAALKKKAWDIVLSDYVMPHFNGLEALALLKESGFDIPFIVLSGTIGEEVAVGAMKAGAHDYLMKNNLQRLLPAVERELIESTNRRERRRMEEALLDSEQQLRTIFSTMEEALSLNELVVDNRGEIIDYKILEVNHAFELDTGLTREQVVGRSATEIYGMSSDSINSFWKEHLDAKHTIKTERYIEQTNAWKHISTSVPVNNRFVISFYDITDHKLLEEEIKQNEFRLKTLIELGNKKTLPLTEIYNFILLKSIELCKSKIGFLGFVDEKEINLELISWSDSVSKECAIQDGSLKIDISGSGLWGEVIKQRKPIIINDYSFPNPQKKGIPAGHIEITKFASVPLFNKGKIVAIVALANKITDYNTTDIIQLNLLLDGMWVIIKERQYQSDLVTAKEKAEANSRLKTEFLHNMSHEIRTPLNGIMGFSELLDDPDLSSEEQKQYTKIIIDNGEKLLRIIDNVLEISQLETKQLEAVAEKVNLNLLLREVITVFETKAQENKIPLNLMPGLSDDLSIIWTDKSRLKIILFNLLENALKFTYDGFIEIGYQQIDNQIEIYIKDTGIGISQEKQEIIFERFSQEDKGASRLFGGLGLGLSIAKENANLIGGRITLESEKGQGSTFYITIPYKPVFSGEKNFEPETRTGIIKEKKKLYNLLIAEDEEVNIKYLEKVIKKDELNINILYAKNGQEAVRMCKECEDLDLVLMDIKMPVMNGYEATRLIRECRPDLPIIAQTAYSTEEDKTLSLSVGCNDFISKPFSEETIHILFARYLSGKKERGQG
ncbi:MAG: response regulator [Bacteroidota bacterium]